MPIVYEIWPDDDYQSLESVDFNALSEESERSWKFDGHPVAKIWKPLEFYVRQPLLLKPDIWSVGGTFAFEPKAAAILQSCLDKAGEQLPLPFEGRGLIVLNTTYVIDCLDRKRSVYDPELPFAIEEYVFHEDRLDYSLFKIPQKLSMLFTVEGIAAPDDEFKPLVEKHRLKGLRFTEVWSSD